MGKKLDPVQKEINTIIRRGKDAQRKTREGMETFALCVYELKQTATKERGGTNFKSLCKDEWGISQPTASRWLAICEKVHKVILSKYQLPLSFTAQYQLSTIPKKPLLKLFEEGVITAETTSSDVDTFKCRLNAPNQELLDSQAKLKHLLAGLYQNKKVSPEDHGYLREHCTRKAIEADGYSTCKANLISDHSEYLVWVKPKPTEQPTPEPEVVTPTEDTEEVVEPYDPIGDFARDLVESMSIRLDEINEPQSIEEAYINLGKILYLAQNKDLENLIYKTFKQKLHPDKDTGDANLFHHINLIQEMLK